MHLFMVQVDYRLFGQVILIDYSYRFSARLMHLFMVQVDVWYMLTQVIGTGCYRLITS
jgi:hypothetical protein